MSDANGRVAPFTLKRNVQYELQVSAASGKPIARVYFAPFKRSNRLVRFLAPSGDAQVESSSSGMVATGPITDMTAGRTMVTVGLYLSDQNKNGKSELGQSFSSNFLAGTDVFLDAQTPAFIDFKWTDPVGVETGLKVPNWPSSEGLLFVIVP
jgi:hypothetical protein